MPKYFLHNNTLHLRVKRSPLIIRIVMFSFAFAFFILPISGAIYGISNGSGFQFSYLIGIGIFSIMGFYLLRLALWNTYGEETIEVLENKIIYEASYGWFKDSKREMIFTVPEYSFKSVGYEEDHEGVLVIISENSQLESVVKMPIAKLEQLIVELIEHKDF
jgi:hypothetical protein